MSQHVGLARGLAALPPPADSTGDDATHVDANAERDELTEAIRRLAPVHREILNLTFTLELSYAEMANVLGVPEGTLSGRLSRGRALLAKRLARHGLPISGVASPSRVSTHELQRYEQRMAKQRPGAASFQHFLCPRCYG